MKQAFVISLEIDINDGENVNEIAVDIDDVMVKAGYEVISVNPWSSPGENVADAVSQLGQ